MPEGWPPACYVAGVSRLRGGLEARIIEGLSMPGREKEKGDKATDKEKSWISCGVAGRGPLPTPRVGSCLTLRIELSEETHVLTSRRRYREETPGWRIAG